MALLVSDIMAREVITVSPDDSLADAVSASRSGRIRHLPVVNSEGELVGIVTDRDLKRAMPSLLHGISQNEHDSILHATHVGRIMTRDPMTVTPSTPAKDALTLMIEHRYGGLPVLDQGKLAGIITETDFLLLLQSML